MGLLRFEHSIMMRKGVGSSRFYGVNFMLKPVKISISSKDVGTGEQIVSLASGKMTEKNNKFYVFYEESEDSDMAGTKTTLKWDSENLIILRSGTIDSRQEFMTNMKFSSIYKTQYLTMPITTTTKFLEIVEDCGLWQIELEYLLDIGNEEVREIKLKLEIEEENQGEHQRCISFCH